MRLVRELRALDAKGKRLCLEAAVLLPVVRVALAFLPFRTVVRFAARESRRQVSATPQQIARIVDAVARRLAGTTCLARVITASVLFARNGHRAAVRLAVASADRAAHAWLESDGRAFFGEPDPGRFVTLR